MSTISSINPSDKKSLGSIETSTQEEIKSKVQTARDALQEWNDLGINGRVNILRKVVENFKKKEKEFSKLIAKEMGMPVSQSVHDVSGAIEYLEWYLDNAEKYLSPEVVYEDDGMVHKVYHEPVGVVAAITPWNFPASNFIWMVGQNLVVGNTVVFKDSEEVPLCGKFIESIMNESDLPEGVFSEVYGNGEIGSFLVNQDIDMICFTGSSKTGQTLYKVAAEKFIKVFLELGGSAPGIIFSDVDLGNVLETIYANRFDNCGQICDGLKRLIVHEDIYDEVLSKLKSYLEGIEVGDASKENTAIGPLVSEKQLKILEEQVKDAVNKGAKVEYSKDIDSNLDGFYYSPTILTNVTKDMRVWQEEVFGPVLPVVKFSTEKEAIDLANDTIYGLGGYIFTDDNELFNRVASQIKTGMIMQNNASYVTPSSPFGGCKLSGIGMEHGKFGFYDLSQIKLVSEQK